MRVVCLSDGLGLARVVELVATSVVVGRDRRRPNPESTRHAPAVHRSSLLLCGRTPRRGLSTRTQHRWIRRPFLPQRLRSGMLPQGHYPLLHQRTDDSQSQPRSSTLLPPATQRPSLPSSLRGPICSIVQSTATDPSDRHACRLSPHVTHALASHSLTVRSSSRAGTDGVGHACRSLVGPGAGIVGLGTFGRCWSGTGTASVGSAVQIGEQVCPVQHDS